MSERSLSADEAARDFLYETGGDCMPEDVFDECLESLTKLIHAQRAQAAREAVEWQDISTAPVNGVDVLLLDKPRGLHYVGFRNDHFKNGDIAGRWFMSCDFPSAENEIHPTHWMHVPQLPEGEAP